MYLLYVKNKWNPGQNTFPFLIYGNVIFRWQAWTKIVPGFSKLVKYWLVPIISWGSCLLQQGNSMKPFQIYPVPYFKKINVDLWGFLAHSQKLWFYTIHYHMHIQFSTHYSWKDSPVSAAEWQLMTVAAADVVMILNRCYLHFLKIHTFTFRSRNVDVFKTK